MNIGLSYFCEQLDDIEKNIEMNEKHFLEYIQNEQIPYLSGLIKESNKKSYKIHKLLFRDDYLDKIIHDSINYLDDYFEKKEKQLYYYDFSDDYKHYLQNTYRKYSEIKKTYHKIP